MSIREEQSLFVRMVGELISYAHSMGYELTFKHPKQTYRCNDCPIGHKNSLHKEGLAIDFNLFINGQYQTSNVGHEELHLYWESIGGARMIHNDANHYSLASGGMR